MTWTNTNAFNEYIRTEVHGEGTILAGAYRPTKDAIEISAGGIIIPVFVSGTVENVSTTDSTSTPNNTLITLVDANKRRVDHFTQTQWNRFKDSANYRQGVAMNQAQDLLGDALTAFYAEIITRGTKIASSGVQSGAQITQILLTQFAKIKSRSPNGVTRKPMNVFLNESGAAAFANDQSGKFNYAPVDEPFFGTWHGAKIWTTNDSLSGSGTIYGGVFAEFGIAYVSADVNTIFPFQDQPDARTGMYVVSTIHSRSLKVLDADLAYWLTYA